jgi:hypothetical protein
MYIYDVLEDKRYREKVKNRLLNRSTVNKETGCRIWDGYKIHGYGNIHIKNKNVATHRVSYEVFIGPIPKDKILMHSCDNPACIEPTHLVIGTIQENNEDRSRKNRTARQFGSSNGMAKLNEENVKFIKEYLLPYDIRCREYKTMKECVAFEYNVKPLTIHNIMIEKTWKNIKISSEILERI